MASAVRSTEQVTALALLLSIRARIHTLYRGEQEARRAAEEGAHAARGHGASRRRSSAGVNGRDGERELAAGPRLDVHRLAPARLTYLTSSFRTLSSPAWPTMTIV